MANQDLIDALSDCIDRLAHGQTIEDCLQHYADYAAELRPMLETGVQVSRAQISSAEVMQAQDRVRFRLELHRRQYTRRKLRRMAGSFTVAILILLIGAGIAAENSLPNDVLYGLKRLTESVRLLVPGSSSALQLEFEQRRHDEIVRLLALKQAADVSFEGELESIRDSDWRIAGLDTWVAPDVPGGQAVRVGDWIQIRASTTRSGMLIASAVSLIKASVVSVTPTAATPTQTSTPPTTEALTPTAYVAETLGSVSVTVTPMESLPEVVVPVAAGSSTPTRTLTELPTLSPATTTATASPTPTLGIPPTTRPALTKASTVRPRMRPSATPIPIPTQMGGMVNDGRGVGDNSGGSGNGAGGNNGSGDSTSSENSGGKGGPR